MEAVLTVAPERRKVGVYEVAFEIEYTLEVAGTESLAFLPLARSMSVKATGNWPHPGFTSGFLPVERRITQSGFEARWQVLDLNRSYGARCTPSSTASWHWC